MHVPDSAVSPVTTVAAAALVAPALAVASARLRMSLSSRRIPLLAIGASFCFTIMMFNIPMPGGTSAHATGSVLLAVMLGPWAALIGVTAALAIQALLFGDGGVLALGINVLTMAFAMPFAGYVIYRLLATRAPGDSPRRAWAAAVGAYVGLNLAAALTAVVLGIQPALWRDASGHALYFPFGLAITLPAMMIPHLVLAGPAEAIVTFLAVRYLQRASVPLHATDGTEPAVSTGRFESLWIGLGTLVALSPLGLLATGAAWGEWSADELARRAGYLPAGLAWREARLWKGFGLLPDYLANRGPFAYALAGLAGVAIISVLVLVAGHLVSRRPADSPPGGPPRRPPNLPGRVPEWMTSGRIDTTDGAETPRRGGRPGHLEHTLARLTRTLHELAIPDRTERRKGLLQALDPRVKIVGLLGWVILIANLHAFGPLLALAVSIGAMIVASRLPFRGLAGRVVLALPLFIGVFTLPAALEAVTPGPVVWVAWNAPRIAITTTGLSLCARLTLRVALALACVLLLASTTRWDELLQGLRGLRLPRAFVMLLGLAWRYTVAMIEAASAMFTARASRDVGRTRLARDHGFLGGAIGGLLGRGLALGEELHEALLARGWDGDVRSPRASRLTVADMIWLLGMTAAGLLAALWGAFGRI